MNVGKKGRGGGAALLISQVYGAAISLRHWLYDKGVFSSVQAPLVVVSVGNVTAGGSGKTPVVALLARLLERHCTLAILSRGYRSAAERAKRSFLVQEGCAWEECGDEPLLLAKCSTVVVGRRRIESAILAYKHGCRLVLLDDGMQHRALRRDIEIVVVEGRDPFGGGRFLPHGRLRERPSRLHCADLVVINGAITPEERARLRSLTKAPFVRGEMVITEVADRRGRKVVLQGKEVAIFCALGSPERFVESVRALGAKVVITSFLPDHRPFTKGQLLALAQEATAKGAYYLCCTEKDWVKLPVIPELEERLILVKGEFVIKENSESLEEIIRRIIIKVGK